MPKARLRGGRATPVWLFAFFAWWVLAGGAAGNRMLGDSRREYNIVGAVPDLGDSFEQQWISIRDYLNEQAGMQFDPPISFNLRTENSFDPSLFGAGEPNTDFVFAHPDMIGCLEAEFRHIPLLTARTIRGNVTGLNHFGGVVYVRNDRTDLQRIADLKDKIVAASNFSLTKQLWRVFEDEGISLFADTAQVRFTSQDDEALMADVIAGSADAAFTRTGTLERAPAALRRLLRVLGPLSNITLEGKPFPFQTTSELYPEYGLLVAERVDWQVQRQVALALLRLNPSSPVTASAGIAAFQPALSYGPARDLYQQLGLMTLDATAQRWRCVRPQSVWENIACPAGQFKRPPHKVAVGCAEMGWQCPSGHECVCRPCLEGQEVDMVARVEDTDGHPDSAETCHQMQICAHVHQNDPVAFLLTDNLLRPQSAVSWILHEGDRVRSGDGVVVDSDGSSAFSFEYSVQLSSSVVGVHILEVFLDGQRLPASPVLLSVLAANCTSPRTANSHGDCVCSGSTVVVGSECVSLAVLLGSGTLLLCAVVVAMVVVYLYLRRRHVDSLWIIHPRDLHFATPPEVLGRGTFGLVVAAEYRKTTVAVKRVIPPSRPGSGDGVVTRVRRLSRAFSSESMDQREHLDSMFSLPRPSGCSCAHTERSASGDTSLHSLSSLPKGGQGVRVSPLSRRGSAAVWPQDFAAAVQSSRATRSWRSALRGLLRCVRSERKRMVDDFMHEMRLVANLRHPCITTVMGAVVAPGHEPMLVLEVMEHGSLLNLVTNQTLELTGELVIPILRHVAQGMAFLHHHPLVHGDLKAANVLVDSQFRGKVADFGLTAKRREGKPVGTPFWMAPELLRGSGNTAASDVFAFGVTLWECCARAEPYAGEDPLQVLREVAEDRARSDSECAPADKRPAVPDGCPSEVAAIMKACWHRDAELRPSFEEVLHMLQRLDTRSMDPPSRELHLIPQQTVSDGKQKAVLERQNSAYGRRVLYDVFPRHVADKLLAGQKVDPEHRSEVTIFFSDIVGFTTIAATQDPAMVSDMLDRLYTTLDDVSKRLHVFKVETIGDAYMAVTNLVEEQRADHCIRIAQFAIEAIEAAAATLIDPSNPSLGSIKLRVGLHSGPVVANVVGTRNPRYCLFGDTVNTASRMESNSEPGRIHCSDRCAKILRKQLRDANQSFRCDVDISSRGEIDIKGKGKIHTFWIAKAEQLPGPVQTLLAPDQSESASLTDEHINAHRSQCEEI